MFMICDDVKWLNGDFVIVKDFEYVWKWVLDFKNEF